MYTLQQWEQKISLNLQRSTGLNSEIRWVVPLPCILEFHLYPFLKLWNLSFDFFSKSSSPERTQLQSNLKWNMQDNKFRSICLIKPNLKLSTLNLTMNILTYNEMENHVRQHKRINIQLKLVQIQSFLVLSMMARMHKHMIFNFCRLCLLYLYQI